MLKDDSKYEPRVKKLPPYQAQSSTTLGTSEIPTGILFPIITYVLPHYMPPSTSKGSASIPPMGGTSKTKFVPPQYSEYRFTQENYAKTIKQQKKFEK